MTNPLQYHPYANIFPLIEGEEFDALVEDICANGLKYPIVVCEGQVLDGRNRLHACELAGVEPRFEVYDGDDPLSHVVSLNIKRRHLDASQRGLIAARMETTTWGGDRRNQDANLRLDRTTVSKLMNVSERTIADGAAVLKSAVPEVVARVEKGKLAVSTAAKLAELPPEKQRETVADPRKFTLAKAREIRQQLYAQKQAQFEQSRDQLAPLPQGKYRVVVADPPWPVEKMQLDVYGDNVSMDYATWSLDKIEKFMAPTVREAAADDCHVFLWTTQKLLPDALRIMESCGFRYVCTFVWDKRTENGMKAGMQVLNLPKYNCEFVVYGRHGTPRFIDTKDFSTCFAGVAREHSRKPDEFYEMIKRATEGPRLDVFVREERDGFERWGNEAEKFDEANQLEKEMGAALDEIFAKMEMKEAS
jgi:N6-adenosine-specific RNA methylase IME4/ParB-like chromosome segregation protein Spo0J